MALSNNLEMEQQLLWSLNLCWAWKLIQIYYPDMCGLRNCQIGLWLLLGVLICYRVRHSKLFFWNLLSQIKICKLNSFWRWFWNPEIWEILLVKTVFMKYILCAIYNPICKYLLVLSEFWIFTNFRGLFQAITSNKPWIR